jgi:hypothetical protein
MFIGLAMAETSGIYGFVIAILILFVRPLVTPFMQYLTVPGGSPTLVSTVCDVLTYLPL